MFKMRILVTGGAGFMLVPLSQGLFATVDDEDVERVELHTWSASRGKNTVRAVTSISGCLVTLHRFIMQPPMRVPVDHRDGNGLNCRRSNLRICTQLQNNRNKRKIALQTSRFKGVSWDARCQRWMAKITVARQQIFLGRFVSEREAAAIYDAAAIRYFGEFARPNLCVTL